MVNVSSDQEPRDAATAIEHAILTASDFGVGDRVGDGRTLQIDSDANTMPRTGVGVYAAALSIADSVGILGNDAAGNGGGVYLAGSSIALSGSASVAGNTAAGEGGGVYVDPGAVLTLGESALVENNTAGAFGHGVRNLGAAHVSGSARVTDGFHFGDRQQAPILDGPLDDRAALVLEPSDYVRPDNVPLAVLVGGEAYPHPALTDGGAVTLPEDFGPRYALMLDPQTETMFVAVELPLYDIRYAQLHGSDNPNPNQYHANMLPIGLLPPGPREGYRFAGWVDEEGNPAAEIPAGASGDQFLVAEWSGGPETRGVLVFRANGPHVDGLPGPVIVEMNQPTALPLGAPTRPGHAFRCWNTMPDGSGDSFPPGGLVVLTAAYRNYYAIWAAPAAYLIRYVLLHGAFNPNPAHYTAGTLPISLLPPGPRDGYRFTGWTDTSGNPVAQIPVGSAGDKTLVAGWIALPQPKGTVVFRANGPNVSGLPGPMTVTQHQPVSVPGGAPTRAGYTFRCWNTRPDGSGTSCQPGGTIVLYTDHQDYFAQWVALPPPPPPPPCPRRPSYVSCHRRVLCDPCAPCPSIPPRCRVCRPPDCCG